MNAEISAFSSGDLNKYEFLTRKDLKYKPNALDKARFEFSPLGKAFSMGLDKTVQGYQEEGVIKLLKDIRDRLRGGVNRPNNNVNNDDDNDDNNDDNNDDIIKNPKDKIFDLVTKLKDSKLSNEEKDKLNNEEKDKIYKMLNKFKDNMKKDRDNFDKKSNDYLDIFDNKISTLNDKIFKIKDTIKNNKTLTNAEKNELQNKIKELTTQRDSVNNEHRRAVNKMLGLKKEKKLYEELKKDVENFFDFTNKEIKYDFNGFNSYGINVNTNDKYDSKGFDIKGMHKDTKTIYDLNDFDINGNHVKANDKYDPNGFNRNGFHRDTKIKYDPNGFDRYGINEYNSKGFDKDGLHKDTNDKYGPNGFDKYALHKETNDKYDPNGFDTIGLHKDTKTIYDPNGFDIIGLHKDTNDKYDPNGFDKHGQKKCQVELKLAKQNLLKIKGKGHVNLPIALSKIYTNNSSKELINNIKQLINDLYNTKQITKQVYNNLTKAIIHMQSTTF